MLDFYVRFWWCDIPLKLYLRSVSTCNFNFLRSKFLNWRNSKQKMYLYIHITEIAHKIQFLTLDVWLLKYLWNSYFVELQTCRFVWVILQIVHLSEELLSCTKVFPIKSPLIIDFDNLNSNPLKDLTLNKSCKILGICEGLFLKQFNNKMSPNG